MCSCGVKYDLQQTKADFVSLRYNNLRNITSILIDQVCHDVRIASPLLTLTGETFDDRSCEWWSQVDH